MILFGLRLAPLFDAIAQVESDRGATSDNTYQLRSIYVEDVNRISGMHYTSRDRFDEDKSQMMMYLYWQYYGGLYLKKHGKMPTYETLARMHNGGPAGCFKKSTLGYWKKVKAVLDEGK